MKLIMKQAVARPLDTVRITGTKRGQVVVYDGAGREYVRVKSNGPVAFVVSGALGTHMAVNLDTGGRQAGTASFRVDCTTGISDGDGMVKPLFDSLWYTMNRSCGGAQLHWIEGKFYRSFVPWLRDHTHTLKGMKYYYPEIKTGFEMYADSQREDGMVWDKIAHYSPHGHWHDYKFGPGGFIRRINDGRMRFERIPVENDVEYLFVECLYFTWKATGDTKWMKRFLGNATKALTYSLTDPYRWSAKYGLLRRGYTIDTWDFMAHEDAALSSDNTVDPVKTVFGVMHGDNTGFAASCGYLAEMLRAAGRGAEAKKYEGLREEILARLETLSWNGEFYRHHVSEDPSFKRDLGVDESAQVSLSNAYGINRGIGHDKCVAIIKTYQRLRREMPASSPGEWYNIFPPFERGFGRHDGKWQYMNGGVSTIVAGELARGAFEHGFEEYGVDIIRRLGKIAGEHGGYLDVCFRGALDPEPARTFTSIDLSEAANVDFRGAGAPGVPGWINEKDNDLSRMPVGRQTFKGIPFDITDPAANGRRACLGISSSEGYAATCAVRVERPARSLYFLHTLSGGETAGMLEVKYQSGAAEIIDIRAGSQIGNWFMPQDTPTHGADHAMAYDKGWPPYQIAWRGDNARFSNVGVFVWGWDNPRPDDIIRDIVFTAARTRSKWFVLAITASDAPVYFPQTDLSYGIPDNWGAAAVVYALVEGLAGVKDTGIGFDRARVAPRWSAAGIGRAAATVRYAAGNGYVAYVYALKKNGTSLDMDVAGCAGSIRAEILLPADRKVVAVSVNGAAADYTVKNVESSRYVCIDLAGLEAKSVRVKLK